MVRTLLRTLSVIFCLFAVLVSVAAAQSRMVEPDGTPRYDDWNNAARQAEQIIENDEASTAAFEALRTAMTEWRLVFETRQSANGARIQTLNNQIAALGDPPAEGETEPAELADRRADLQRQLVEAQVPVRRAEEAYTLADGLVREVDELIRDRQTDRILRLDPSPLNPVSWPVAGRAMVGVVEGVTAEIEDALASPAQVSEAKENLPLSLALIFIGLVLVIRSARWIDFGLQYLRTSASKSRASIRVAAFMAAVFSVILPFAGLFALIQAGVSLGFLGTLGMQLLDYTVVALAFIIGSRWLASQVFSKAYPPAPVLPLTFQHLREGRLYTGLLGALVAFDIVLVAFAGDAPIAQNWPEEVLPVLRFPIVLLAGIVLFRMGQLLFSSRTDLADEIREISDDDIENAPSTLIIGFLARSCMAVGVISPTLAAIGYVTAGGTLLVSTAMTLGLLGLVAVLQRFMRDVFGLFIGDDATGSALMPVLLSFALVLLALPVLALIWGARVADLSEAWEIVRGGFAIGETTISPTDFFTFVFLFGIGYGVTRLLQGTLRTQVLPKTRLDTGGKNALIAGTGYVGIFLAAVLAITGAGIDLSSLAIVAGALSVGIGFGLQTIVSNFVSGIILLIERPISEGDWIEVGGTMGVVRDISVRATRVETFDRTDVIVPNADLISNSVVNWTKGNLSGRLIMSVGVAYGTDTKRVADILSEIAQSHPQVIISPPPNVLFMNFGADSLEFEIRMILRDVNFIMDVRSEVNHEIARRFGEEGIEIPFAQRDVWLRNPETLNGPRNGQDNVETQSAPSRSEPEKGATGA